MLVDQFISGFLPQLKARVISTDRNLKQLLVKARFEEAKSKELAALRNCSSLRKPEGNSSNPSVGGQSKPPISEAGEQRVS